MTEPLNYPLDDAVDLGHTAIKVAIGFAPGGGALAEVFNTFIPSSLAQRRDQWGRQMTEMVNALVARGVVTIEDLQSNPDFIDLVIEATITATKTSNEMKRTALVSAIASSAQRAIEPDKQHMFVRLVDELTEMHIRLLLAYAVGKFSAAFGSGEEFENRFLALVGNEFPALNGQRDFILHLCSDLANRSLIATPPKGPRSMVGMNVNSMRITQSGTEFLKFIGL